jgi:serine/threonine protein kinase
MGVVYKARQLEFRRLVALKLIRDGALAGQEERARFRMEAESVARVRHPNVVEVFETGEHQGRLYFAMELVNGGSLAAYLTDSPQPANDAAELVRTLARAIAHAHAQQVIHRDLKPGNILVRQTSHCGDQRSVVGGQKSDAPVPSPRDVRPPLCSLFPLISDFGLAKRLDQESTAWTQDGAVLGTANYMAPEQASGRVRDVGPSVDIYALGAILYELLTGRPPFLADTKLETIQQVLFDDPVPPTRHHASVPRDLETVCLKCLEKEPGRRYASAAELADDLGGFLAGRRVAAVPTSDLERLSRMAARDGYQIVDEIGRGPQSIVYRAHFGPLHQPVALKVFPAILRTPQQWESQIRCGGEEGGNDGSHHSLVAALAHPNIVPVQQAGCLGGVPYVASEYLPHGCLASRLDGVRMSIPDVLSLVEQIAQVVMYLHRQGIVHANLKPTNILFAASGIARIVDFHPTGGLFQGPLPPNDAMPDGLGYLAPELLDGHPNVEPRFYTDVYGLGVVLYEALTGRPPLEAATVRDALEQVRSQDPVPPGHLNSKVAPQLDTICLRCLRKDPWRRYRRVYDLSRGLRWCLEHQ